MVQSGVLFFYTDMYPEIVFTPTVLRNAPETVAVGEVFELEVEGSLSLLETVNDITFPVSAHFETETELTGYGATTILLEEFGITVPMPPRVTWVADEVILELDFTAVSSSPPSPSSHKPTGVSVQNTLIQLIDPLDESDFYCVDVPGFGATLRLDAELIAHTCKPGPMEDEVFSFDADTGMFSMPAYDMCMQADTATAGSLLHLAECTGDALQRFQLQQDESIRLQDTELCLTVAGGESLPAGELYVQRSMTLESCVTDTPHLAQWQLPGGEPHDHGSHSH